MPVETGEPQRIGSAGEIHRRDVNVLLGAQVHPGRSPRRDLNGPDLHLRVGRARLGIADGDERGIERVLVDQIERPDRGLIDSPERDPHAVGAPAKGVA